MKPKQLKNFFLIALLIAVTGAAMAYSSKMPGIFSQNPAVAKASRRTASNGIISVSGLGSAGTVDLNLTLQADQLAATDNTESRNVDLVIVLDRSGSMKGLKISDARQAVLQLLTSLTAKDRLSLCSLSNIIFARAFSLSL